MASESASSRCARSVASTRSTATSDFESVPTTRPFSARPSSKRTVMRAASLTTWALVRMTPSAATTKPVPWPPWGRPCCGGPNGNGKPGTGAATGRGLVSTSMKTTAPRARSATWAIALPSSRTVATSLRCDVPAATGPAIRVAERMARTASRGRRRRRLVSDMEVVPFRPVPPGTSEDDAGRGDATQHAGHGPHVAPDPCTPRPGSPLATGSQGRACRPGMRALPAPRRASPPHRSGAGTPGRPDPPWSPGQVASLRGTR